MTEAEKWWHATNDHPRDLMEAVERLPPSPRTLERRFRLFLCGCARRVADYADDPATMVLIDAAERYADGGLPDGTLAEVGRAAGEAAARRGEQGLPVHAFYAALATGFRPGGSHTFDIAVDAVDYAATATCDAEAEWAAQTAIFKDIFGNPFHPVALDPAWLTSPVLSLARTMYEARDFSPMPILADALQDAGCDEPAVLDHCRGTGPHVRGCWVVDLLLGKE